jgi:DNA-binding NtrC family response regulator
MHTVAIANPKRAVSLLTDQDEELASRSAVRLLITVSEQGVEALARRIHGASLRGRSPFVRTRARDLPTEPRMLRDTCSNLLDAAAGGTILISDVEELPPTVQRLLVELLAELEVTRAPSDAVRLIAGTTVSLLDRIAAGTFSDRLFYRLNAIHLSMPNGPRRVAPAVTP